MSEQEVEGRGEGAKLHKLAVKKKYDEFEVAWTKAVEKNSVEPDGLLAVLEKAARGADPEFTDSLLWFLLSERAQQKGAADALAVAKAAVPLFPESKTLRQEIAALYAAAHASVAGIDALVQITVLSDTPLPEATARIEKFFALTPGTYVLDPATSQPGRVAGFNAETAALEISFEDRARAYGAGEVDSLERLDADDFRALFVFDPEKLRTLADDQPDELVTRMLRAFGPRMTFKALRSRIAGVVPPESWAKWWAAAKPKLQRAEWVGMSGKSQPEFVLRTQAIPYDAQLKAQFNGAADVPAKLAVVAGCLRETGGQDAGLLEFFGRELLRLFDTLREKEPAFALGALAVAAKIRRDAPDAVTAQETAAAELLETADLGTLMQPVQNDDLARLILEFVRETAPDRWPETYAALMPACPQAGCDAIAAALCEQGRGDCLRSAVGEVLARPEQHVPALCWLWKAVSEGKCAGELGDAEVSGLAVHLFSVAHVLGRASSRAKGESDYLLGQVRSAVSAKDFAYLQGALEKAGAGRAQRIRTFVERHIGLSDSACSRVHELLRRTHPDLFLETIEPWEEDVVYTTEAGLRKRKAELEKLVTGRMADAARAVGEAAAEGDLSENFGWSAALAERDRLAGTATRMQEEIAKARTITPELAQGDTVTVGSAVDVKDPASGRTSTMTFLGPWDADHDKGIHSYQAKLGLAFMGKAKGDQVKADLDGQEHVWEIMAVRPSDRVGT